MNIRPTDLPAVRSELIGWLSSRIFGDVNLGVPGEMVHPALGSIPTYEYGALLAEHLKRADLFFVATDMTRLAQTAARSLPPIGLDQYDPPSRCGFMLFQEGAGLASHGDPELDYLISAVAWMEVGGNSIVVERFTSRDHMLNSLVTAGIASPRDTEYSRSRMPRLTLMAEGGSQIPYGARDADHHSQRFLELDRVVRSAWLLMQQPVSSVADAEYKRHDRRRLEQQKIEPSRVRVITLRRSNITSDHGDSDREFHHQWIVRGHWRQQWYPSRGVHRPVWIAPHLKGPEGAPMLGGEKVHAWVR